jgi:CHAT domain-containing protein/tetratricopeptide (TPR) repeat protein
MSLLQLGSASCQTTEEVQKLIKEGTDLYDHSKYKEALEKFEEGLRISRKLKNKRLESCFLMFLGKTSCCNKDYPQALNFLKESLSILKEIDDNQFIAVNLSCFGVLYSELHDFQNALLSFQDLLKIYRDLGDKNGEGRTLGNIGNVYNNLGEYQKALTFYQDSLKIYRDLSDKKGEGIALGNIGNIYDSLSEYQKALTFHQDSLKIHRDLSDKKGEGMTLSNIGNLYHNLGEYQKALTSHQDSLKIHRDLSDKKGEGTALNNIGNVYCNLGEYQKALAYYQDYLIITRDLGDKKGEGTALNNIGNVYSYLGEYQKALTFHQDSLKIHRDIGDKQGEGSALGNIGCVYDSLGEYQKALTFHQNSLKITCDIGDKQGESNALSNIGNVYCNLGEYQKALTFHQDSLKITRDISDKKGEGNALSNIGNVYYNLGEYQKALTFYQDSLIISRNLGNKQGEGHALGNIGIIYDRLGEYQKALTFYQDSLKIKRDIGDKQGESNALSNIGNVYSYLGEYQKALTFYQDSLKIHRDIGDKKGEGGVLNNIGRACKQLHQADKAIENLKQSIDIFESIREALKVEEHRISFMQKKITNYNALIDLLLEKHRYEEAWSYLERSKARTCLDMLGNRKIDFREKAAPELIRKEKELDSRIMALRADLNKEGGLEKKKSILAQLEPLQNEYEQVLEKMKLACPEYSSLRSVQVTSLKDIQDRLDEHTLIMEYLVGNDKSALFLIDNKTLRVVPVPYGEKAIKEMMEDLERRIATKAPCNEQIETLSQALIAPSCDVVKGKEKLIIVPYSTLYYLPFGILKDDDGNYLVKNHQIITQPSASVWTMCLDKKLSRGDMLSAYAIGDYHTAYLDGKSDDVSLISTQNLTRSEVGPLPATSNEVESISALYPGGSVLIGKAATAGKVRETIKTGNLVHFATHGILDPKHPLFSGLVLSDRLLTTAEIFSLETDARIVVLSACNTAGGELSQGDELVGISRAFMYAGASVVVASLWRVSDKSTAQLMKYFYEGLKKGEPEGQAMRNAQLTLMKDYPHPYYWAPFVVIGEAGKKKQ